MLLDAFKYKTFYIAIFAEFKALGLQLFNIWPLMNSLKEYFICKDLVGAWVWRFFVCMCISFFLLSPEQCLKKCYYLNSFCHFHYWDVPTIQPDSGLTPWESTCWSVLASSLLTSFPHCCLVILGKITKGRCKELLKAGVPYKPSSNYAHFSEPRWQKHSNINWNCHRHLVNFSD